MLLLWNGARLVMKFWKFSTAALLSIVLAFMPAQGTLGALTLTSDANRFEVLWPSSRLTGSSSVLTSALRNAALNTPSFLAMLSAPLGTVSHDVPMAMAIAQRAGSGDTSFAGSLSRQVVAGDVPLYAITSVLRPRIADLVAYAMPSPSSVPISARDAVGLRRDAVHVHRAIPQRGSYALLLAGLGMIALAARRRMQS